MARSGSRILPWLLWPRALFQRPPYGGLDMDSTMILAIVMVLGLVVYLSTALLKPEKFS